MQRIGLDVASLPASPLTGRIWFSNGTRSAATASDDPGSFLDDAFVPRGPWREPFESELADILVRDSRPLKGAAASRVKLFRVPSACHDELAAAAAEIAHSGDLPDFEHASRAGRQAVTEARARRLTHYASELVGEPLRFYSGWRLGYWGPGRVTATANRQTPGGKLIGLHIDTWEPRPVDRRYQAPSLISVNIGPEERHFMYVDLGVAEIFRRLSKANLTDGMMFEHTAHMPARFFTAFASYPVTRITLAPGEGYVAPVENIIHDASTETKRLLDVFVTCRIHLS